MCPESGLRCSDDLKKCSCGQVCEGVASESATQWGEGPGLEAETRAALAERHGLSEQQMDELTIHGFQVRCSRLG